MTSSGSIRRVIAVLQELCNSPRIEAKVIEFCITCLYLPNSHELLVEHKDVKKSFRPSEKVYNTVCSGILDFLRSYLPSHSYVLRLPRALFLTGLDRAIKFKYSDDFKNQISGLVSVFDLLFNLLDVLDARKEHDLIKKLRALNLETAVKTLNFQIVTVYEDEEDQHQTVGIMSSKTCRGLIQATSIQTGLTNVLSLLFFRDVQLFINEVHLNIAEVEKNSAASPNGLGVYADKNKAGISLFLV